jgi:putative ABC transport system permease protein
MFRSYFAAALRNLARSRFYAGISIAGLAIGLWAALLSFLVIRSQLTFDHFIPGYERIYLAVSGLATTGRAPDYRTGSNNHLAQQLQLRFNEV